MPCVVGTGNAVACAVAPEPQARFCLRLPPIAPAMATYATVEDFKTTVRGLQFASRASFLWHVKWARIQEVEDEGSIFRVGDGCRAVFFLQALGLLPETKQCEECGTYYRLRVKRKADGPHASREWLWKAPRGVQYGCEACNGTSASLTKGTVLANVHANKFDEWLDVFCMWALDTPDAEIRKEVDAVHRHTIRAWCRKLQATAGAVVEKLLIFPDAHAALARRAYEVGMVMPGTRRTAAAKAKARAKGKGVAKAKAKNGRQVRRKRVVVQIDETYLNKERRTRLAVGARPRDNQIWLWGPQHLCARRLVFVWMHTLCSCCVRRPVWSLRSLCSRLCSTMFSLHFRCGGDVSNGLLCACERALACSCRR